MDIASKRIVASLLLLAGLTIFVVGVYVNELDLLRRMIASYFFRTI